MASDSGFDILHSSLNNVCDEPVYTVKGRQAWKAASKAAKTMTKSSKIVNPEMEKAIPRFEESEISVGRFLGSGGFNNCHELHHIDLIENPMDAPNARKICSALQKERRAFVAKHVYRESSNSRRYAIKFLSPETVEDPERFRTGAADLVIEAKFLASLDHPNIIKLRGMSAAGTRGFGTCREREYFIILDRLQCTLEDRLEAWREHEGRLSNNQFAPGTMAGKKEFLARRLHVIYDVASALEYLHQRNVIYRDLKPDNIGFDHRGNVKLFDFGLAKELNDSLKSGYCEDFYELSGNTGSLRYMSPEVARGDPYNLLADVYSFGLLVWQVCALQLPYDGMTRAEHSESVVLGQERPPLFPQWSTPLRLLMKRTWESDPAKRPAMAAVRKILKREITALRDGDESGLESARRRPSSAVAVDSKAAPPANSKHGSKRQLRLSGRYRLDVEQPSSGLMKSKHSEQPRSSRPVLGSLLKQMPSKRNAQAA